jgi:hypothetical protein
MAEVSQAGLAVKLAGVGGRYVAEQLTRPRPTDRDTAPGRPDRLTEAWLTDALYRDHPGAHVTGFSLGEPDNGSTSRQRLTVTYDAAGEAAGLPTTMFTKSTPNLRPRCARSPRSTARSGRAIGCGLRG